MKLILHYEYAKVPESFTLITIKLKTRSFYKQTYKGMLAAGSCILKKKKKSENQPFLNIDSFVSSRIPVFYYDESSVVSAFCVMRNDVGKIS